MASAFKGAKGVAVSEQGQDLAAGTSKCKITRIVMLSGFKGDAYIVEYDCLSSDNAANKAGGKYRWYRSMKERAKAFPDLHKFTYAASGYDRRDPADAKTIEDTIAPEIEDLLDQSVDQGDPLKLVGRLIDVTTRQAPPKADPKNPSQMLPAFMYHDFAPGQPDKLF